jgi:hypothetical protein
MNSETSPASELLRYDPEKRIVCADAANCAYAELRGARDTLCLTAFGIEGRCDLHKLKVGREKIRDRAAGIPARG